MRDKMANIYYTCIVFCLLFSRPGYSFLEKPSGAGSRKFLVLGDGGGINFHPYHTPVQTSVAAQMARVAAREGAEFTVLLGDNFYLQGVTDVDDPRFQQSFENIYDAPSLKNIPWYVIAGNHDYYGNVSAQIAYTKRSNRWKFPDYYHKVHYPVPGGKTLDILLLDTMQLCGNVYTLDQPAGPKDVAAAEAQWAWLEDNLNKSSADYIIVAGHYPMWSISLHGPTDCLTRRLEPLLFKYKVTAYLAGHDHNLQHIVRQKDSHTLHYFVIGCGNFIDVGRQHANDVPGEELKFFWADYMYLGGFGYFEVSDSRMEIRLIDGVGQTRYHYNITSSRQ